MTKKNKPKFCKDCEQFYLKHYGHDCPAEKEKEDEQ